MALFNTAVCGFFILFAGIVFLPLSAVSDSAIVTYTIPTINEIDFSGNPATLTISSFTPGVPTTNVTDSSTTWALSTNLSAQKITASLNSNMPTGLTLSVSLTAPSGGTSLGFVSLSTTSANLVTGISNVVGSGLSVSYRLGATVNAAPAGANSRIVTFTIGS